MEGEWYGGDGNGAIPKGETWNGNLVSSKFRVFGSSQRDFSENPLRATLQYLEEQVSVHSPTDSREKDISSGFIMAWPGEMY